uniref:Carboxypeptidase inhibitor n=1 Tax=Rhipicephalus zambeziensis TaxID=60191 RepID=A0A224Y2N2_9ACAR
MNCGRIFLMLYIFIVIAYSRSKTCDTKKYSCVPERLCRTKVNAMNGTCKGKGNVCCNIRKKHTCTLFGGRCKPKNTHCHYIQKASKSCGKKKKCCTYLE